MKLLNLATRDVITVKPSDTLDKAISLMEEHAIHHLPVVLNGVVKGIVSDRDLLLAVGWKLSGDRHLGERGDRMAGPTSVSEVMVQNVVSLSPSSTVHEAACAMTEHRISAVPVLRGGVLIGVVTKLDLLVHVKDLAGLDSGLAVLNDPVEQHMRAKVFTVGPRDTVQAVIALMREKHLRHVPVVVGDTLIGIISDRDARRACGIERIEDQQAEETGELYIGPTGVSSVLSSQVRTITPKTTLLDAASDMASHHIGALPVVRDERLVGIITDTDIVRFVGKSRE